MNFRFFVIFCVEFCIFSAIFYEFLSGFRDKFQKSDVCRFFNQICENKLKNAENSEIRFCEFFSLLFITIHSCPYWRYKLRKVSEEMRHRKLVCEFRSDRIRLVSCGLDGRVQVRF